MNMKTNVIRIQLVFALLWSVNNHCVAQTNLFSTIWLNDHGVPQWGSETNWLKSGLGIKYMGDTNHTVVQCTPLMQYTRPDDSFTNMIRMDFLPPPWRYQMTLLDEKGNMVEKTTAGKSMGRPLATMPRNGK